VKFFLLASFPKLCFSEWNKMEIEVFFIQMNPKIGDISANKNKIIDALKKHENSLKKQVFLCPELSLIGYPPMDLNSFPLLYEKEIQALEELQSYTQGKSFALILGHRFEASPGGSQFYNGASVLHAGKIHHQVKKVKLPHYNVFQEKNFFLPFLEKQISHFELFGETMHLSVCEDIYDRVRAFGVKDLREYPKELNPLYKKDFSAKIFINLSASPYYTGKAPGRMKKILELSKELQAKFLYCNQVGAQDELNFDGRSCSVNNGDLDFVAPAFQEGTFSKKNSKQEFTYLAYEDILQSLLSSVRDYFSKTSFKKALLGLSGGIDSALCTYLCAQSLGPENTTPIFMPSQFSSQKSKRLSQELCANLNLNLEEIEIDSILEEFSQALFLEDAGIAYENLQSRIRGTLLMTESNRSNSLVIATGNKSEYATGYGTLYGDMCGAMAPIGDLYKTEVFGLCHYINHKHHQEIIPLELILRPPTAELAENQLDEDSLPPYECLDTFLFDWIENQGKKHHSKAWNELLEQDGYAKWTKKCSQQEFKRSQCPFIPRVHLRSFGRYWQMPLSGSKDIFKKN